MTYAGTHPLNMNSAPSFLSEFRITAIVELEPGPEAFMIRLCSIDGQSALRKFPTGVIHVIKTDLNDICR